MQDRLMTMTRIRRKLEFLRHSVDFSGNLSVFNDANRNADLLDVVGHRYLVEPPLSESSVVPIERQLGIRLPDGFRAFLLEVGNGGAGPCLGLYPLKDAVQKAVIKTGGADSLVRPFPYVEPFVRPEYAGVDAIQEFIAGVDRPGLVDGTLPIADCGCGIDVLLVVTGPARGTLWMDDRHSDNGLWPICLVDGAVDTLVAAEAGMEGEATTELVRCDFLTWYDAWLDERIDIHARYSRGEWHASWTEARRDGGSPNVTMRNERIRRLAPPIASLLLGLAMIGIVLSAVVHLCALFRWPQPFGLATFSLHVGAIALTTPSYVATGWLLGWDWRRSRLKFALRGSPVWLTRASNWLLWYAAFNLVVAFIVPLGRVKDPDGLDPYALRFFSSLWLAGYLYLAAIFRSAQVVMQHDPWNRCPKGHPEPPGTTNCGVCRLPIPAQQ